MSPGLLAIAVSVGEPLQGLDLSKGRYAGLPLGGGVFSQVHLGEADLRGADLRETVFDACDLRGTIASGANLRKAVFNRCKLDHADLREANLHRLTAQRIAPTAGIFFNDMLVAMRRIRNHALNLAEAVLGKK